MLREPNFGPEEARTYGEALDALDLAGVHYMLGGALALSAYTGIWRDTKDLDVFVPGRDVARVLEVLENSGFETEIAESHWLAKAWRGDLFVDVIHANDSGTVTVQESWFANAKEVETLSRRVRVIPAEEMFLSKIFVASRDRWDMSDVVHLIFARRGELDWERILAGTGEHWELLFAYLHLYRYVYPSHAHYVPRWVLDLLLKRYEEEVEAAPRGPLRFRGTLLDDVSFGVDVEAWGLPDEHAAIKEARRSGEERG
jgi:putative nucleotidyltransferase-like protein